MNCCDHNECCGHSDDRIGAEIGMLHNLLRRQMACMTEKTANAANVTGMQAMIVHHLIIHENRAIYSRRIWKTRSRCAARPQRAYCS